MQRPLFPTNHLLFNTPLHYTIIQLHLHPNFILNPPKMDYNYHYPYNYYPKTQFYPPAHNDLQQEPPIYHHMKSSYAAAAAQLGITAKEFAAINDDCIRQQQEFAMAEEQEYMAATTIECIQPPSDPARYEQHKCLQIECVQPPSDPAELTIHADSAAAELGLTKDEIAEELTTTETQHPQWDHYNDNVSARSTPPPHKHHMHDAMNDGDVYVTSLEHHVELNDDAARVEPDHGMIEPLMDELVISGVTGGYWAADVEEEMEFGLQGEYIPTNYAPIPPTAPTLPTTPSTTKYTPPRTHYACPPTKYILSHSRFTHCYPPLPLPRPQHVQRPLCENRTGHVTMTRHACFCTTTGAADTGLPRYVPPALQRRQGTPREPLLPPPNHSDKWRDLPPHKMPPTAISKRSDSPNWRKASPGHPVSF
jgi:hypothetical protein